MNKFGIRMAVAAAACSALSLGACWAEDTAKSTADGAAKTAVEAAKDATEAAKDAADAAATAVAEAAKDAAEKADQAVEAAKDAAADAAVKVEEAVDAAKDAVAAATEPAAPAEAPAASEAPAAVEVAEAPAAADATPAEQSAAKAAAQSRIIPASEKEFKDARWRLKDGTPIYNVEDGVVDWASWQGFRRYHDACHVCHGPNALGGSFAPNLADSVKTMSYEDFVAVVAGGRVANRGGTEYVMPALGGNPDVMCYLDDIYTYVKGRSSYEMTGDAKNAIPPGRPAGRADISEEAKTAAAECLGD